ncbi:acyltransferase [Aliarcobacter butzleri]|uniref:acyltransferase n=1 Tax=Aliarcobacter butzleri TaxID=28197 RepID=UPI001EDABF33|nr:acyltransferase [Aliarcobacter butzleri]MCG3665691.1 acyltransferase [Aliarcobacter butzleri]
MLINRIYNFINYKLNNLKYCFRIVWLNFIGANIEKNVKISDNVVILNPANLNIGENSTINHGVHINCRDKVIIGKDVRISTNVQIHSGRLIIDSYPRIHTKAPITIEDNVWIASGCVISAGVKISQNSVIGANSVILEDVDQNSFYAGNPAKKIKNI